MKHLSFLPYLDRGAALDKQMRHLLAESLNNVYLQLMSQDCPLPLQKELTNLRSTIITLEKLHKVNPLCFAAYFSLVEQVPQAEHDTEIINSLRFLRLCVNQPPSAELKYSKFNEQNLGGREGLALYHYCMDTNTNALTSFKEPKDKSFTQAKTTIAEALKLLHKIAPEMHQEFQHLVNNIICIAPQKPDRKTIIDGASSYLLWGALIINVEQKKSILEMLETLVHESSHSLLFGLTMDEPLVLNSAESIHPSPLRSDKRPMDGVYHATFVLARMCYILEHAKSSDLLSSQELTECNRKIINNKNGFFDGFNTLQQAAELSETGKTIINNAHKYITSLNE